MSAAEQIDLLLASQDGVIARFQVLEAGETDDLIARKVRRREWARMRPGCYVNHTGVPTWHQRSWAAVLAVWPAALSRHSVLRACGVNRCGDNDGSPIKVAIAKSRGGRTPSGIAVERIADYDGWVRTSSSPPRVRLDVAILQVASPKHRGGSRGGDLRCCLESAHHGRSTGIDARGHDPTSPARLPCGRS